MVIHSRVWKSMWIEASIYVHTVVDNYVYNAVAARQQGPSQVI